MNKPKAEEVIDPSYLGDYTIQRDNIMLRLKNIGGYLYIIEKIEDFPLTLFTDELGRTFWLITKRGLIEAVIVGLGTLLIGDERDVTLGQFSQRITNNLNSNVSIYFVLENKLRQIKLEQDVKEFREKLRKIRNRLIAHVDHKLIFGLETFDKVSLLELQNIFKTLYDYFCYLCFDIHPIIDFDAYAPRPYALNYMTDVEMLLAFVASRSYYLKDFSDAHHKENQIEALEQLAAEERSIVETWRNKVEQLFPKTREEQKSNDE